MKSIFTLFFTIYSILLFGQSETIDSLLEVSWQKANLSCFNIALDDLNLAISIDNKNPKLYCARGFIKAVGLNEYKSAYCDYDTAVILKPDEGELYILRAMTAMQLKNYTQSYNDFKKAYELMPEKGYQNYPVSLIIDSLNNSLSKMNEKAYLKTIKYSKKYFIKNDYRHVIIKVSRVIKTYPDYYLAYSIRGLAYQLSSMDEYAYKDYHKAVELNNYCYSAFFGLGKVQCSKVKYSDAIISFSTVLIYKPEAVGVLTYLGYAYLKSGIKTQACEIFKNAEILGDTNATRYIKYYCK